MEGKESNSFRLSVKKPTILRAYICISLVLSSLSLVCYLSTLADAFRVVLNPSWAQLVVASTLGMSMLVFLVICVLVFREKSSLRIQHALSNWLSASGKPTESLALVLSGFVFGVILLVSSTGLGETALHYHFSSLRPFSWWLTLQTAATLVVLFLCGEDDPYAKPGPVLLLILILLAGTAFHIRIQPPARFLSGVEDVY